MAIKSKTIWILRTSEGAVQQPSSYRGSICCHFWGYLFILFIQTDKLKGCSLVLLFTYLNNLYAQPSQNSDYQWHINMKTQQLKQNFSSVNSLNFLIKLVWHSFWFEPLSLNLRTWLGINPNIKEIPEPVLSFSRRELYHEDKWWYQNKIFSGILMRIRQEFIESDGCFLLLAGLIQSLPTAGILIPPQTNGWLNCVWKPPIIKHP